MIAIISIFGISLLCGMTLFTWKIYTFFLKTSPLLTHWLLVLAVCVPVFFLLTILSSRAKNPHLPRWIYFVSDYLAGFGYYLFLCALALSTIGAILLYTKGITLPYWIVSLFVIAPLVLTTVGFIQAKQIQITNYTVTLPNFPSSWDGKRFALVTDTHFGIILQKQYSDKIVNTILAQHPDFVLHGGDFYDGPSLDTTPISESWKKLTNVVPVFYAPGNHELYGDYAGFIKSIDTAGITVLEDKKVSYEGVEIGGMLYHEKNQNDKALHDISLIDFTPGVPHIMINHQPAFMSEVQNAGTDLMVSGHTHNGQFWPNTYIVRMIYGIYTYGLQKYDNMFVITSKGVGTAGPPLRLFNNPEIVVVTIKTK